MKRGFNDSDVSDLIVALIGEQSVMVYMQDILFSEEYEADRQSKSKIFVDALEKSGADKVDVSLVSSTEIRCKYHVLLDQSLTLKLINDVLVVSGTRDAVSTDGYLAKGVDDVLYTKKYLLTALKNICKGTGAKKVSVTTYTDFVSKSFDDCFDDSQAEYQGYEMIRGSGIRDYDSEEFAGIFKFEWNNIFYDSPDGMCRRFYEKDRVRIEDALQRDLENWYDENDNIDVDVESSLFDRYTTNDTILSNAPEDTNMSITIQNGFIFVDSQVGDNYEDDICAVTRNTMNLLKMICSEKCLYGVKVFALGTYGKDYCYNIYAEKAGYKISTDHAYDIKPTGEGEEFYSFYWFNKDHCGMNIDEKEFDFWAPKRSYFYREELLWLEGKVGEQLVKLNCFPEDGISKYVDCDYDCDDSDSSVKVSIEGHDSIFLRITKAGYIALFTGPSDTVISDWILSFGEMILYLRWVCMRMDLRGITVHYTSKNGVFRRGKSKAKILTCLKGSDFGDFHLINGATEKLSNDFTKYVIKWDNPIFYEEKF